MTNESKDLQSPWVPTEYVLAAIDSPDEARRASQALTHAGFHAERIQDLQGDEASERLNTNCQHCGAFKHIARMMWRYFSIQGNVLGELEKQSEAGSHILTVHLQESEEAKPAADILLRHQAHHVLHFGPYGEVVEYSTERGGVQSS